MGKCVCVKERKKERKKERERERELICKGMNIQKATNVDVVAVPPLAKNDVLFCFNFSI